MSTKIWEIKQPWSEEDLSQIKRNKKKKKVEIGKW